MKHSSYFPPSSCRKTLALLALLAVVVLQAGLPVPAAAGAAQEQVLEDLQFRVDAWILTGAARAGVILKSLGDGRYRAEVAAEAQGLAKALSGQRRDNFSTEMVYQNGRLLPLVYREESRRWGKHSLKEYRFDYDQGRLELWQHHEGKGLLRKWETALTKEPIYDPLTAFYNFRLGALGQPKAGQTLRVRGIPYPRPEEIVIQIGQVDPEGRKVMVSLINRVFDDEAGVVFVFFDEKWAPSHGWTRILSFGKVAGKILPESRPLAGSLLEMLSALKSSRFRVPSSKLGE
ncbi:MAG: DUF3108 domain-containing protein [Deltaproteobacteria bacterium]|nr:DUF3108 domain-containing protein [Deltaproteobacteria bacterium]MBI4795291.1 DUF3108 domain-containing protein [Deltaproteobacteria bacterium]